MTYSEIKGWLDLHIKQNGQRLITGIIGNEAYTQILNYTKALADLLGVANGIATLDADGKLSEAQRPEIHAAATKATPDDSDEFGFADSENSFVLKKLTWSAIKTALKSFFDTIYLSVVSVDNLTITGNGTVANPLVANQSLGSTMQLKPAAITIYTTGTQENQVKTTIAQYYEDATKYYEQRFDWNEDLSVSKIEIKDDFADLWVQRIYIWTNNIPSINEINITEWTIL